LKNYVLSGTHLLYGRLLSVTCPVLVLAVGRRSVGANRRHAARRIGAHERKESSVERTAAPGSKDLILVNKTNAKLDFEMSDKPNSDWKPFTLAKGATLTDSKMRYIRIQTVRGRVVKTRTYDLQGESKRYGLVWNKAHNCWDVWREQQAKQASKAALTANQKP
jgi:hypothetical protein